MGKHKYQGSNKRQPKPMKRTTKTLFTNPLPHVVYVTISICAEWIIEKNATELVCDLLVVVKELTACDVTSNN